MVLGIFAFAGAARRLCHKKSPLDFRQKAKTAVSHSLKGNWGITATHSPIFSMVLDCVWAFLITKPPTAFATGGNINGTGLGRRLAFFGRLHRPSCHPPLRSI